MVRGDLVFFGENPTMAYTAADLTTFFTNANLGAAPSAAQALLLSSYAAQTQSGAITDAAEADCTASVTGSAQRSKPGRSAGAGPRVGSVGGVEEELAAADKLDSLGRFRTLTATKASAQAGQKDPSAAMLRYRTGIPAAIEAPI